MARRRFDHSRAVIALGGVMAIVALADLALGFPMATRFALRASDLTEAWATLQHTPGAPEAWRSIGTLWSYAFVHAGVEHIGFNLLYFWFFGSLLYEVAGDRWVLGGFLFTTATAGLAFVLRHHDVGRATVLGASGSVSGLAGLYVLLAFRWSTMPHASAWPLARPIPPIQAALFALIGAATDVYMLSEGDGVARDAHLGGFAGGLFLGMLLATFLPTWEQFLRSKLGPSRLLGRR